MEYWKSSGDDEQLIRATLGRLLRDACRGHGEQEKGCKGKLEYGFSHVLSLFPKVIMPLAPRIDRKTL